MDECAQMPLKNPFFGSDGNKDGRNWTMGSLLRVNTRLTRSVAELPGLDEEPEPASLVRSCPRSFDFVRVAHFAHLAQDDTHAPGCDPW
jgi:hypothetical protein